MMAFKLDGFKGGLDKFLEGKWGTNDQGWPVCLCTLLEDLQVASGCPLCEIGFWIRDTVLIYQLCSYVQVQ